MPSKGVYSRGILYFAAVPHLVMPFAQAPEIRSIESACLVSL
jgi:hypothetical protein